MSKLLKSFTATVLTLAIFFSMVPAALAAGGAVSAKAEVTAQLEAAIPKLKELLDIGSEYQGFGVEQYKAGTLTLYRLTWYKSEEDRYNGNITASYGSDGNLYSFYDSRVNEKTVYYGERTLKTLATFSKEDARAAAAAFLKKAVPSYSAGLRPNGDNNYFDNTYYQLSYSYYYNDIPVRGVGVNVAVSVSTGKIVSFNLSENMNGDYPPSGKIIPAADAAKVFAEELELRLIYTDSYNGSDNKPGKNLTPVYYLDNSRYAVDAVTGKLTDLYPNDNYGGGGGGGGMKENAKSTADSRGGLNEAEIAELDRISGLMDENEIIAKLRSYPVSGFDTSFTLRGANLFKQYDSTADTPDYAWYLDFYKEIDDEYLNFSASLNASTGELLSFSSYSNYYSNPRAVKTFTKTDYDNAKTSVLNLLKKIAPEKFGNSALHEQSNINYGSGSYYFTFERVENGIPYPSNGLTVNFDAAKDTITNFGMNWYKNPTFKSAEGIVSKDKVLANIVKDHPARLEYYNNYNYNYELGNKISLLYFLGDYGGNYYDAYTGKENAASYQAPAAAPKAYADLTAGSALAKAANSLLAIDVYIDSGEKLRPSEAITQQDFLFLLSKCYSYSYIIPLDASKKNEDLYNDMISRGVILKNEVAFDKPVTREMAAVFIVRELGYDKLAQKSAVFVNSFRDNLSITAAYRGHAAIAKGMGIISGFNNNMMPKTNLTRGDAIFMAYKMLKAYTQ